MKMTKQLFTVRKEQPGDFPMLSALYHDAMGEDEIRLVTFLKEEKDYEPQMSLVADSDGIVIGHILFSKLKMAGRSGRKIKGAALAPMAVLTQCQRMGVGSTLIEEGIHSLSDLGYEAIVVLGHTGYYPKFGFSLELGQKIQCPYSGDHLMAMELLPRVLSSEKKVSAIYSQAFSRL